MICAYLLILQEPELALPLDTLSPWDRHGDPGRTEVFADLQAQSHRRFIKTHTPLDGIPNDPTVTYICVGRDPRDVASSIHHHIDNTDIDAFLQARERAAAIDGIELGPLRRQPPGPTASGTASGNGSTTTRLVHAGRVLSAVNRRAPTDVPRRRRRTRRRPPALRRPEGRPAGPDAAAGRPLRHPCQRAPMAPPGPSGDVRLDAQAGPTRSSPAVVWHRDRPRRILQPRHKWPVARPPRQRRPRPGTQPACGLSPRTSSPTGCTARRST